MKRLATLAFPALLVLPSLALAQYGGPAANGAGRLERSDYNDYLRRDPVPTSTQRMHPDFLGHTPQYNLATVLSSDQYYRAAGANRASYIRRLYADVIGREPLPAEMNYWAGRLDYESRRDVTYQMLRHHPRESFLNSSPPPPYDPGYFPDPASPTFADPGGPYFHSPYYYNYERSRPINNFMTRSQG